MITLLCYSIVLIAFSIYSYALIDPNITFFQSGYWVMFRDQMVYLGYYRRDISWLIYLVLIILLFLLNYLFVKKHKQFSPIKIAIISGIILLFSHPFLSHDFFNYMFDAKIATYYHKIPYLYKALDFPADQWLRFMQWTHRTYPYGPVFLLISFIPSFLSFGKFVLSFFFFKITFVLFYILGVYYLQKLNRKWAIIFATNPLVIVEGLISSHNDLIGVSLAIIGIFHLIKKHHIMSRICLLLSLGIKYITTPLILVTKNKKYWNLIIFLSTVGIIAYISFFSEVQPWYFLTLFAFLPFYEAFISKLNILFAGLLISYYPYIRLGGWDTLDKVNLKHNIVILTLAINLVYLIFTLIKNKANDQSSSVKEIILQ